MQNDRILDVIDDLRRFADMNGYAAISTKLEEAALTAVRELSGSGSSPDNGGPTHAGDPQPLYRQPERGRNAG